MLHSSVYPDDSRSWESPKEAYIVQKLKVNLSELSIKFLIKHSRSVAEKLIEIKRPPENLSITPEGDETLLPTTHVLLRMVFGDSRGIAWIFGH